MRVPTWAWIGAPWRKNWGRKHRAASCWIGRCCGVLLLRRRPHRHHLRGPKAPRKRRFPGDTARIASCGCWSDPRTAILQCGRRQRPATPTSHGPCRHQFRFRCVEFPAPTCAVAPVRIGREWGNCCDRWRRCDCSCDSDSGTHCDGSATADGGGFLGAVSDSRWP